MYYPYPLYAFLSWTCIFVLDWFPSNVIDSEGTLIELLSKFFTRCFMILFSNVEQLFFWYVGIFLRLPPQNPSVECGETRNLCRWIGFDSYVRTPSINTGPPQRPYLIRLTPSLSLKLSCAAVLFSLPLLSSPLNCRKEVTGGIPADRDHHMRRCSRSTSLS